MATDLELLLVRVEANLKQYEKEMARARQIGVRELRAVENEGTKAANKLERAFAGAGSRVTSGLKSFGAGVIAGLGVEQIARAAASAIKSIADIGESAKKLGLGNQEFQTLSLAAQLSGVEVDALASAMKKLGVNSSDASRGQGEFAKILKANGVSITETNGQMKSQVEILGIVANLVQNAASEQDKLAIAQAALGKSGTELMNLLEQGAIGVQSAMQQAASAGTQFSDEQIAKGQEFDHALDLLIEKISFGLKGAFIDAAIGAESFATSAIAQLDAVGIKAGTVGQAFLNALKYNPIALSSTLAIGALQGEGKAVSGAKAAIPLAVSGDGKTSLPGARSTIVPSQADEQNARAAEAAAKRAAEEAKRRREQIQGVITDLKFEGDQLKRNELQQQINTALRRAEVSATSAQGQAITQLVTANFEYEESQKRQKENVELNKKAEEDLVAIRIDAAEQARQKQMEAIEEQRDGMMQLAEMGVNALERIAIGGEKAKDVALDLAKAFASAAIQGALLGKGPLASLFGGGSSGGLFGSLFNSFGGGSSGGLFGSLFNSFGGGSSGGLFGSLFNSFGGGVPASIYHSGGVVGNGGPSRNVPMSAFSGAPRYHSGGMAGFKPGEIVIPRGGSVSGGGRGKAQINVNISGATGNAEVQRMVQMGVAAGLSQYARGEQQRTAERQARG